jgi:hypothetical protein
VIYITVYFTQHKSSKESDFNISNLYLQLAKMLSKKDSKLSIMYMDLCVPQLIKLEARGGGGALEWDSNCVCVTVGHRFTLCAMYVAI